MPPPIPNRTSPEECLRLHNLGLHQGERWLFRGMKVEIPPGSFVAITGPSGVGKTSLLACIAGLRPPTEGRVESRSRSTGLVFQSFRLVENATVLTNVLCGRLHRHSTWRTLFGFPSRERQEAFRLLVRLGLQRYPHCKVARISGGEKQRVAVARAVFQDPDLYLADEPVSQLDDHLTTRVLQLLKEQTRRGKTVLCVSHERRRLKEVADYVLDLNPCWPANWTFAQGSHVALPS